MTPSPDGTTWSVAIDAPLGPLHYYAPTQVPNTTDNSRSSNELQPGDPVYAPLGARKVRGVLLEPSTPPEGVRLKSIYTVDEERPQIPPQYLEWLKWLSHYYCYPIGQTAQLFFAPLGPGGGRKKARKSPMNTAAAAGANDFSVALTSEQRRVVDAISQSSDVSGVRFQPHLLYGVTGSGKTEVYMELIGRTIERGEQALVLVPEISLTPQLIERFARRFGEKIAVIHSHLTPREKTDNWWAAHSGQKPILIGARSALFCPLKNLGIIVVDEEHEASFKQEESLRYHARDAAVMLAKIKNIPILLGSATPSLESWENANRGRYALHRLDKRIHEGGLPQIEVIDLRTMRDEQKQTNTSSHFPFWLSPELHQALTETVERGEQAALFLNRRGIAQSVICPSCGTTSQCPNCEVALTLHGKSHLVCHYCDYHETLPERCPHCHEGEPKAIGLGTEKVEQDLALLFPKMRSIRMDRDEIQSRQDLEIAIQKIENHEVEFLIGTQMIAKGLDFPKLTLVGIVMADIAFNLPDFRASERAFQLLTQVSGRSGRHLQDRSGRVIIQTYNPDHPSIQYTVRHDYEGFAEYDLSFRKALNYPPFGRLAALKFAGSDQHLTEMTANKLAAMIKRTIEKGLLADSPISKQAERLQVLGPAPAPLSKLRNLYRFQVLLRGHGPHAPVGSLIRTLDQHINTLAKEKKSLIPPKVRFAIDIDALHLL